MKPGKPEKRVQVVAFKKQVDVGRRIAVVHVDHAELNHLGEISFDELMASLGVDMRMASSCLMPRLAASAGFDIRSRMVRPEAVRPGKTEGPGMDIHG